MVGCNPFYVKPIFQFLSERQNRGKVVFFNFVSLFFSSQCVYDEEITDDKSEKDAPEKKVMS